MATTFLLDGLSRAHLPEAEAYQRFLRREASTLESFELPLRIRFMGFRVRVPGRSDMDEVVVDDYPSASIGRFRGARDWAKRNLSARSDIAVLCGPYVQQRVAPRGVRALRRDMGFFAESIQPRQDPDYDVVYAGTLARSGVLEAVADLSRQGLRIAVASADPMPPIPGVAYLGRLEVDELYGLYSRCRLGLNVVPNAAPYAYQASTKVIEYCAAGLGVVTTRTPWIDAFEQQRGGRFMTLGDARSARDVLQFGYRTANVEDLAWDDILNRCGLIEAVREASEAKGR